MASKEIMSSSQKRSWPARPKSEHPVAALQREMNRVFDNFFSRFDPFPSHHWERGLKAYSPRIDITDGPKALRVTAELPGLDEKDIEVQLTTDALTIRGHKSQESEDKGKNYYRMERSYGSFHRMIPIPVGIDPSKAEATFKKGVLTITLAKSGDAKRDIKKIQVKAE